MTKKEKESAIESVKEAFELDELRPFTFNRVIDENGFLTICTYKEGDRERIPFGVDRWNSRVYQNRWRNGEKRDVISSIIFNGNAARRKREAGYCLIEIIDSNIFEYDEFVELFEECKSRVLSNEDLYTRIKNAILNEIKKDKESINAWCRIAYGFKDEIGTEIWEGDLEPTFVVHGKTSWELQAERLFKEKSKQIR